MLYRIITLSFFIFNLILGQSEYEFLYQGNIYNGDIRSMGIGNADMIVSSSGLVTGINPAKLSYSDNSLEFNLSMISKMERRSITILDSWGEFLADTDYVFNDHNYYYGALAFNHKFNLGNKSYLGFGLSRKPHKSYNYTYEEEVRAKRDYPDGFVGIKDPIIGYQIFKTEGHKYTSSIGLGYGIILSDYSEKPLAVGIGFNFIDGTSFKKSTSIDTLHNTFNSNLLDNFDDIVQNSETSKILSLTEVVLSIEIPILDGGALYLNYKSLLDSDSTNSSSSIGLELNPNYRTLVALQYNIENNKYEKNSRVNIGFEYYPAKRIPLRAGLEFREFEYGNISTLTLGTGKKIGKFDLDIALNYYSISYYRPNPFSENFFSFSDCNIGCDKVIDNNLLISTSIKWSF